jgi:cytochrome c-type biogenesis protein CcmE
MKVKWTVGLIIAIGALTLFFLSNTGDSKPVFYYSPTEFLADASIRAHRVKLKGIIDPGSVRQSQDKLDLWFTVSDGTQKVPVHYHGAVPDAFQEGLQVVVDGRMGAQGVFEGHELIVKCPSKYESQGKAPSGSGASPDHE